MKKGLVLLLVFGFLTASAFYLKDISSQFRYVGEDEIGKWYFDRTSLRTRIDEETGLKIIDVWMRREVSDLKNTCGTDDLLWHIDPVNFRYKISDAVAKNKDGTIAET